MEMWDFFDGYSLIVVNGDVILLSGFKEVMLNFVLLVFFNVIFYYVIFDENYVVSGVIIFLEF